MMAIAIGCSLPPRAIAERVNFSRDVLPLLSDRCFHCHGPDPKQREADLRLDQREDALAAIVPGDPADSDVWEAD